MDFACFQQSRSFSEGPTFTEPTGAAITNSPQATSVAGRKRTLTRKTHFALLEVGLKPEQQSIVVQAQRIGLHQPRLQRANRDNLPAPLPRASDFHVNP